MTALSARYRHPLRFPTAASPPRQPNATRPRAYAAPSGNIVAVLRRALGLFLVLAGAAQVALAQGLASGVANHGPFALVPAAQPGTWNAIASWVAQPGATIALLVAGCLLLFHDLLTPLDWGLTGTGGVVALGLVFASHYSKGTGGVLGVVLLLGGLTGLLLEIHVYPGRGLPAFAGLFLLFLGMFWSLGGAHNTAFALPVAAVLTVVSLVAFFAYLPKSSAWKKVAEEMQRVQNPLGGAPALDPLRFLGRTGEALTALRPSGVADIDGVRVDVITEGDFLEPGASVLVTHIDGARIVVSEAAVENSARVEAASAAA